MELLHVGKEKPSIKNFMVPQNGERWIKPFGGFWCSSYLGDFGSDWVQWCLAEQFGFGGDNKFPSWLLVPSAESRIFVIDSYADLEEFHALYGLETGFKFMPAFDFEKIALDYDAVRLTEKGQMETRHTSPLNLYGWDSESVLWLRFKFDSVRWLGEKSYKQYEY